MRCRVHVLMIVAVLFSPPSFAAEKPIGEEVIPAALSICSSFQAEGAPRVYSREDMYEHINGEAELFKRFGVRRLVYASFSTKHGDSVTVEMVDFETMEGALGIFRLYSGCDEGTDEVDFPGFRILRSGTSAFALKGNLFMRVYTFADTAGCGDLAGEFVEKIFSRVETESPIPSAARVLEGAAGRRCDVSFHPDDADVERGSGPGYRWKDGDANECYMRILGSKEEARRLFEEISRNGGVTAVMGGHVVSWTGAKGEKIRKYLEGVVGDVRDRGNGK